MLSVMLWGSVGFIIYAYGGYPVLLAALSFVRRRPVRKGDHTPTVSFIVTAYNEEKRIREKLENTLAQDYPADALQILVASDASTDRTDEIVNSYASRGVQLIRAPERRGKEGAQQLAVEATSGEILVFSDVSTVLDSWGVTNIVRNFNDPTVGCVSSVDRLIADETGALSGEGAYVRYEMALRKLESEANTLVGLSGSFFAARREVCQPWAADLQSDFNTLLNSIRRGLRGVLDPESIGYYRGISDETKEYERKIRTVVRGLHVVMTHLDLLNPVRYGMFAWQLFSHKMCRWLVPFAMISALITNLMLFPSSSGYRLVLACQAGFYLLAVVGILMGPRLSHSVLRLPSFFVLVNLSLLTAWYRYVIKGQQIVKWEPSVR